MIETVVTTNILKEIVVTNIVVTDVVVTLTMQPMRPWCFYKLRVTCLGSYVEM